MIHLMKQQNAADDVGDASKSNEWRSGKYGWQYKSYVQRSCKRGKGICKRFVYCERCCGCNWNWCSVLVVGSLVAFFTKTKKGAELLEIATASLGVVMGKLTDTLSGMGEIMVGIFTDPVTSHKRLWWILENICNGSCPKSDGWLGFLGSAVSKLFKRDFAGAMEDAKKGVENLQWQIH